MNILMLSTNDPAGVAINFAKAVNEHTEHTCRLITTETRYNVRFPVDIHVPDIVDGNFDEIERLLKTSDIIHFHMANDEHMKIGPLTPADYIEGKTIVHHHHGEPLFRADPGSFAKREERLGRKALVSTPDLHKMYPASTWIPNPIPIENGRYLPRKRAGDNRERAITVGHSPTRKDLKNTDEFVRAIDELQKDGVNIRSTIIEKTPHPICLRMKGECDIFFDHMQGYYGVSSLEALSQGTPTIAGLDEWNIERLKDFTGASCLPWVIARTEGELKDAIRWLVANPEKRGEIGEKSRRWMEEYWTERTIASALVLFYEGLN